MRAQLTKKFFDEKLRRGEFPHLDYIKINGIEFGYSTRLYWSPYIGIKQDSNKSEEKNANERSRRLATKPKEADPSKQARKVLLVKLGMAQQVQAVNTELLEKYEPTFAAPLSASKQEAFKVLFHEDSFLDDFAPEVDELLPEAQ